MYSNVMTAIDKIHMYLLCFDSNILWLLMLANALHLVYHQEHLPETVVCKHVNACLHQAF